VAGRRSLAQQEGLPASAAESPSRCYQQSKKRDGLPSYSSILAPRPLGGQVCQLTGRRPQPMPHYVPLRRHAARQAGGKLRRMIEEMDTIEVIDDDTRKLIEKRWPWLLDKLTPKKPSECDTLTSATPAPAASRALTVHGLLHREGLNGGDDRRCRFRVLLANPSRALHHASETHKGCLPSRPAPQDQDSRLGDAAGTLHCKPPTPSCRLPLPRCRTMQRPGWTKGS
jgi:hypothetical protein